MNIVRYTYPSYRSLATLPGRLSRSPWSGLETEIDRLFAAALPDAAVGFSGPNFPVDLYEDENNAYVRAELPGVNRDEINVEMIDDYLTITAVRKSPAKGDGKAETPEEQSFSFSRSVSIPDAVQADKVTAAYENGVLTVTLPRREEAKPKKVTVAIK
jgi:HSP20 family protein